MVKPFGQKYKFVQNKQIFLQKNLFKKMKGGFFY